MVFRVLSAKSSIHDTLPSTSQSKALEVAPSGTEVVS